MAERDKDIKKLDDLDKGDEVTSRRVFQNLQIDGLKPSLGRIRRFISTIKNVGKSS